MPKPEPILDPIGPILFHREVHRDQRGAFVESYHERRYEDLGLRVRFVQTNCSTTMGGVLRGLHFQHPTAQGKLVSVTRGAVFDVAADIRVGSPTFGRWYGVELSAANGLQLWIPLDFAHGFVATSDEADILYHCTAQYDPISERTLRWDDPELAIEWPTARPVVSPKDAAGRTLAKLAEKDLLPRYRSRVDAESGEDSLPVTGAAAHVVL
ncbi:MAG: dTDP-4-dehydrorhamnose 3,5-epimerase [Gemmatimonadota bacterium]|nr:dTDP-4-dehydrorhamnose 3,5-epimerase [Gemmatimonadota bacterium]